MPYDELLGWYSYLEMRPVDWRNDARAFRLIQTQGFKGKPWDIFDSLKAIYNSPSKKKEGFDVQNFKASIFYHKMLSAKNGEKISAISE